MYIYVYIHIRNNQLLFKQSYAFFTTFTVRSLFNFLVNTPYLSSQYSERASALAICS